MLRNRRQPYDQFVELVEEAIDHAASDMARQKNVLVGMNEDQLTNNIITAISNMGFDAQFERNNGGNCDISITEYDDMLWLGEAKIYKSGRNLLSGLQQLVDRYATGLPNEDNGSLIIYVKVRNAKRIMAIWQQRLAKKLHNGNVGAMDANGLTFRMTVQHAGSGRNLHIRHLPIILYHKPTEANAGVDWTNDTAIIIGSNRTRPR